VALFAPRLEQLGQMALQLVLPMFGLEQNVPQAKPAGRSVLIGGQAISYQLKRSKRRSIGFLIDDKGLTVTAPRWATLKDIDEAIAAKSTWITRKLVEWREHSEKRKRLSIEWRDGVAFPLFGKQVLLKVDASQAMSSAQQAAAAMTVPPVLYLSLPPEASEEQIRNAAQAWCQHFAKTIFAQRLEYFAQTHAIQAKSWALSSARTRWGSCTADGRIRLNWRLVHFPLDVIDYVIAHELAHLKELNHGPQFWHALEKLLPGYEQAKLTLARYPDDW
jgi:predicted metal-dependent hydrolase